jgi:hypothetical protein
MAMSSTIMSAAGAAQQTVGAYYGAASDKIALGLQADLDAINARLAEGRGRDALARGEREYGAARLKTAALKSSQRTGLADAGFDLGFGSAAQVLTSTDMLGEVDAETIKANAMREAWGHRLEATGLRGSAAVNRAAAKSINPTLAAMSTLLTAGGQVASQYYSLKASGAFDKPVGGSTSSYSGSGPTTAGRPRSGGLGGRY